MKTSIEIDEKKITTVKGLLGPLTLREIVDKALKSLIAQSRRKSLIDLLGSETLDETIDLGQMRGRSHGNTNR